MQKLHTLVLVLFSGINMECYLRLILSTQIRLLINQQCSKFFDIKKKAISDSLHFLSPKIFRFKGKRFCLKAAV